MRLLNKSLSLIRYVLKRQRHHPGLTLLALLRVVFAVSLVTYTAFFAFAVERVILDRLLTELSRTTGHPPFSALVYTFPSLRQPLSLQAAEELASHVAGTLSSEVGLPVKHAGLQVGSGAMRLQPKAGSSLYHEDRSSLSDVNLVFIANVGEHIDIVAGDPLGDGVSGEALDVWMHTRLAEKMGVQVGDQFDVGGTVTDDPIPLRVRGFWDVPNPIEPFWFNNPEIMLQEALLVRRGDYISHVERLLPSKTRQIYWHVILDEDRANPAAVRNYIHGFERAEAIISKFVPDAGLNASPLVSLEKFVQRETVLTTILLSFNLPAFGFLLYFLVLTSAIIARWQRRDTASLVSRGMSTTSILSLTLVDELLLFIVGFPLGIGFGMLLARLMGHTSSFLSFVDRPPFPISFQGVNWPLALAALCVALIARLIPATQAAQETVVSFYRERGRPLQAPFWYRYYLDFLLLAVTIYVYGKFSRTGTLALLVQDRPEDLFKDPLLILVPALFVLTTAMLTVRVFRLFMRVIDLLVGVIPWTIPYLVLRRLSRQNPQYINPLLLIIVALALGVYTISMAASLDQWLVDRVYYRVGADLTFEPLPPLVPGADQAAAPIDGGWIPLPGEFADLPQVEAAIRVGDYDLRIAVPGDGTIEGRFLAIDRLDFPSVAWFRRDLAQESLGALMNRLALGSDGILVSEEALEQSYLQIGDEIEMTVSAGRGFVLTAPFTLAGTYKHFPTVYDQVTVIGNMEYLSSLAGVPLPHHLWLRTEQDADGNAVLEAVRSLGVGTTHHGNTRALIEEEKAKMERVGVFGTLSVGFLAAVVMAAIGLLLYSYASLRERLYRFAMWRAIGLMRRQIVSQVILEYTLLTACGATVGAFIGMAASELFVPFFRITGEGGVPLPTLIPVVAQQDAQNLVITFAGIMVLLQMVVIARALSWRHFRLLRGVEG